MLFECAKKKLWETSATRSINRCWCFLFRSKNRNYETKSALAGVCFSWGSTFTWDINWKPQKTRSIKSPARIGSLWTVTSPTNEHPQLPQSHFCAILFTSPSCTQVRTFEYSDSTLPSAVLMTIKHETWNVLCTIFFLLSRNFFCWKTFLLRFWSVGSLCNLQQTQTASESGVGLFIKDVIYLIMIRLGLCLSKAWKPKVNYVFSFHENLHVGFLVEFTSTFLVKLSYKIFYLIKLLLDFKISFRVLLDSLQLFFNSHLIYLSSLIGFTSVFISFLLDPRSPTQLRFQ